MKHRRRKVIWLGIVLLLGFVAWLIFRNREPMYDGKRLSEWLTETGAWYHTEEPNEQASAAIKSIGVAAIPFLLKDLQIQPYPWERLPDAITDRLSEAIKLPVAETRQARALAGFRELGAIAAPAIPELDRLAAGTSGPLSQCSIYALGMIGTDAVVSILLKHLATTNSETRVAVIATLADMGERAASALPAVRTNLNSADLSVRRSAVSALPRLTPKPDPETINELKRLIGDPEKSVRRATLRSISSYASEAAATADDLEKLTQTTTDAVLRRQAQATLIRVRCEYRDGGIIRGSKNSKAIALAFTAHEYAEGAGEILAQLERHRAKGSFFLTGNFLANTNFTSVVGGVVKAAHYVGPHSDQHLLYCSWDADRHLLVTESQFQADLNKNLDRLYEYFSSEDIAMPEASMKLFRERYGGRTLRKPLVEPTYFLPPFEHYNQQIVAWSKALRLTLINYTPGTRSNADYTGEADTNFVSSQAIFDSIMKREREDPHGLNGFILLLHLGSGPHRADKFHTRFGELLDVLAAKGYQFVRVDELLEPPKEQETK